MVDLKEFYMWEVVGGAITDVGMVHEMPLDDLTDEQVDKLEELIEEEKDD